MYLYYSIKFLFTYQTILSCQQLMQEWRQIQILQHSLYIYIQNDFTTRELYKGLHSPWHVPRDRSAQARSSSSSSRAHRYLRVVACCTPPPSASPEFHAVMCGRQAWQKVTRQFFFLFFFSIERRTLSSFLPFFFFPPRSNDGIRC